MWFYVGLVSGTTVVYIVAKEFNWPIWADTNVGEVKVCDGRVREVAWSTGAGEERHGCIAV